MKDCYVYKYVNKYTGEFYIGIHSGGFFDDYEGSGTVFSDKFLKDPTAWLREIIEVFNDRSGAKMKERQLVSTETLRDPKCLNIEEGGEDLPTITKA